MKLESDLSCHPRLSGARGRVINNSSLSARLLQNAQSSQRCRIIHLLQIVKHRVIPVSAPRPRHLEFIIETASHSSTRRNKSQSMLQILLRQAILWSDNLLIQSTVYFNWSDYDFWGCNWLINVDCLNYLPVPLSLSGWWLPGDGLRTLFAVSCCGQGRALRASNLLRKFAKTLIEVSEVSSKQGAWFGKLSHWKTDGQEKGIKTV